LASGLILSINRMSICLTPDNPLLDDTAPDAPPRVIGPCERVVRAQLATMPAAAGTHAGEAESCIVLAAQLDDRRFGTSWPSAARQLRAGLAEIRNAAGRPKGKLYEVALMARHGRKPAG
jgi:hypothetical protein